MSYGHEYEIGVQEEYTATKYTKGQYEQGQFQPIKFPYILFFRSGSADMASSHYFGMAFLREPFQNFFQRCYCASLMCLDHRFYKSRNLDLRELIKYFWQSPIYYSTKRDLGGSYCVDLDAYENHPYTTSCSIGFERILGRNGLKIFKDHWKDHWNCTQKNYEN